MPNSSNSRLPAPIRAAAVGIGATACLISLPFLADRPLLGATTVFLFIVVQNFSPLAWMDLFPCSHLVRRLWRNLSPLLAIPFLGVPAWNFEAFPLLCATAVAVGLLAPEWRLLKMNLSPGFAKVLPPLSTSEKIREAVHFGSGGAMQEYVYRGLLLGALAPHLGMWSIVVTSALFVAEHLMHFNARTTWDRTDILNHSILAVTFGSVVYFTGSFAAAVVAHTIFNAPNVLQVFLRSSVDNDARAVRAA